MREHTKNGVSRRRVLRATAGASGVAVGLAGSATGSPEAKLVETGLDADGFTGADTLGKLATQNVVMSRESIQRMGVDQPDAVRSGRALMSTLRERGYVSSESLDAFAAAADTVTTIRGADGGLELSLEATTDGGRVQLLFEETTAPSATVRPTDGGPTTLLSLNPDGSYGATTPDDSVDDGECGGCSCESGCLYDNVLYCQNEYDGNCRTTSSCGCQIR